MSRQNLTELVKARVEPELRRALQAEAQRAERSEGAVLRLALRRYLAEQTRGRDVLAKVGRR